MSFKRDGNDTNLLKNLQHRRVIELLGDHIPNDEASLLSNGRLTCTVCSKRPLFDSIQMLSLHRKGKKHLFELSLYLQHKRDIEHKKAKQTQKSFLKTDQITIETDATSSSSSFVGYPKSFSKRKGYGISMNRKFVLDITESCAKLKSSFNPPTVVAYSANSQVRKYLKSLSRKQPLEKTVNKLRESYGGKSMPNKLNSPEKPEAKKADENLESSRKNRPEVEYHLKLLESGWVQDVNRQWVKDPNVEFDTDEEEPPSFS